MRLHISLEDDLVAELDQRIGPRRRSAFVADAVRAALEDERRWEQITSALGALGANGGDYGEDAATWVEEQRFGDPSRVG